MNTRTIALVLGTATGGLGEHVAALAEGLVGRGWPVRVCGPASTEALFGFTARGAGFVPVPIGTAGSEVRAVRPLRRGLAGSALVHAHGLRAATVAAMTGHRPLVVTLHNAVLRGRGPTRAVLAAGERVVARSATVTLAASEDLAVRSRELGARDVRFAPVALPVRRANRAANDVRAEFGIAAGQPLIVAVGRLHPQKAHDILIAAATRWRDQRAVVLVVGDGPQRAELQRQIDRAGVPVRLVGRRSDVPELLAAADVVVLASRWEARALVAQEALLAGRPLVATAVGGLPSLLGDAALLVPPDDSEALSAAVLGLLDSPDRRADLGRRGAHRAAGWPTSDDTLDQVEAVYRELLGISDSSGVA